MDFDISTLDLPEKQQQDFNALQPWGGFEGGTTAAMRSAEGTNIQFGRQRRPKVGVMDEFARGATAGTMNIISGLAKSADALGGTDLGIPRKMDRYFSMHGGLLPPEDLSLSYITGQQLPLMASLVGGGGAGALAGRALNLSAKGVSYFAKAGQFSSMFNVTFGEDLERIKELNDGSWSAAGEYGLATFASALKSAIEFIGGPEKGFREGMVNRVLSNYVAREAGQETLERLGKSVMTGTFSVIKETGKEALVEEISQGLVDEVVDAMASGGEDSISMIEPIRQGLQAIVPAFLFTLASSGYRTVNTERLLRRIGEIDEQMVDSALKQNGEYFAGSRDASIERVSQAFGAMEEELAKTHLGEDGAKAVRRIMERMSINWASQREDVSPLAYIERFKTLFVESNVTADQVAAIENAINTSPEAFDRVMNQVMPNYNEFILDLSAETELSNLRMQARERLEYLKAQLGGDVDLSAEEEAIIADMADRSQGQEGAQQTPEQIRQDALLRAKIRLFAVNRRIGQLELNDANFPAKTLVESEVRGIRDAVRGIYDLIGSGEQVDIIDLRKGVLNLRRMLENEQATSNLTIGDLKQGLYNMTEAELLDELNDAVHRYESVVELTSEIEYEPFVGPPDLRPTINRLNLENIERDADGNITPQSAARIMIQLEDRFGVNQWPANQNLSLRDRQIRELYDEMVAIHDERTYLNIPETSTAPVMQVPQSPQEALGLILTRLGDQAGDYLTDELFDAPTTMNAMRTSILSMLENGKITEQEATILNVAADMVVNDVQQRIIDRQISEAEERIDVAEINLRGGTFNSLEDIQLDDSDVDVDGLHALINAERANIRRLEVERQNAQDERRANHSLIKNLRKLSSTTEIEDAVEATQRLEESWRLEQEAELARIRGERQAQLEHEIYQRQLEINKLLNQREEGQGPATEQQQRTFTQAEVLDLLSDEEKQQALRQQIEESGREDAATPEQQRAFNRGNALSSSQGIGSQLALYLIRSQRAFSSDNASRRAMEIIDRLKAGEYESVVKEYPDMPPFLRQMVDTFVPRGTQAAPVNEQLSLFSEEAEAQKTYAIYDRSQKLAVFFNTSTAEDVLHEWFHHIADNALLPEALYKSLMSTYGPEGKTLDKWSPDDYIAFHEKSVRAFMAYMLKAKTTGLSSDTNEAFKYIRNIMAAEAHYINETWAPSIDPYIDQVFAPKRLSTDNTIDSTSIREEQTMAELFDEAFKEITDGTYDMAARVLHEAVAAEDRAFPTIAFMRSQRAIEEMNVTELNRYIHGGGNHNTWVKRIAANVLGVDYDPDGHYYKETIDRAKAGDQRAMFALHEMARYARESAITRKLAEGLGPNWWSLVERNAEETFGQTFDELTESQRRGLIRGAQSAKNSAMIREQRKAKANMLAENPLILSAIADIVQQVTADRKSSDPRRYQTGRVKGIVDTVANTASALDRWTRINFDDFYTFLDALDGGNIDGAFNRAFGTRLYEGNQRVGEQVQEDDVFLKKAMKKYGGIPKDLHVKMPMGSRNLLLTKSQAIGLYALAKSGQKSLDYMAKNQLAIGATEQERMSVIKDAVKFVEGDQTYMNFYKYMQDYFKYIHPKIDAVYRDVNNLDQEKGRGLGKFSNVYFPHIHTDGYVATGDVMERMTPNMSASERRIDPNQRQKTRTGGGEGNLDMDSLSVFLNYQRQAQTYIGKARMVLEMSVIAQSIRQQVVNEKGSGRTDYYSALHRFIEREQYATGRTEPLSHGEQIMRNIRANTTMAMLIGRPIPVLRQSVSLINAMAELPLSYSLKLMSNFAHMQVNNIRNPSKLIDAITGKHNPFEGDALFQRMQKYGAATVSRYADPDFQDLATQAFSQGALAKVRIRGRTLAETGMAPFRHMDMMTVISVWNTAFDFKYNQMKGALEGEALSREAGKYANKVVERTQPPSGVSGRNLIQTGREGVKALFPFHGQLFKNFQYTRENVVRPMREAWSKGGLAEVATVFLRGEYNAEGQRVANPVLQKMFFTHIIPAVVLGLLARRREPESLRELLDDMIAFNLTMVPSVGGVLAASWYYKTDAKASVIYLDWVNGVSAAAGDIADGEGLSKYTSEELLSAFSAAGVPELATRLGNELLWFWKGEEPDLLRAFGINAKERDGE